MTNMIPKNVEDMFLSAGIDKQRAFEFIVRSNLENFREICSKVNPENNPEIDDTLRYVRRREKNRQAAKESLKQLKRIQGMNRIQGMLRRCQLNPEVEAPPQPGHYREDIEMDDIALIAITTKELNRRLKEKGITVSRQREIKSERRFLKNRRYAEMNRRYMGETRNVGVARQSAEEENELVDCADGMDVIGQTRFSLEQMAELEERFQVPEIEISVVEIPDELENTIEEEYVWVFHDDVH